MHENENLHRLHESIDPEVAPHRHANYEIDPVFLNRWSPRAFSSEEIPNEIVMSVLEAGRWAASSMNEQPWRYIIARSEDDRKKFVSFLMEGNQVWAKHAPVLILIVAKKTFTQNGKENKVHQFDAGTSSGYIALQARLNGLYLHGMGGFDPDQARALLGIPTDFIPLAVFALGKRGRTEDLPQELREREVPSTRRPLSETVMEGKFIERTEDAAEKETAKMLDDN